MLRVGEKGGERFLGFVPGVAYAVMIYRASGRQRENGTTCAPPEFSLVRRLFQWWAPWGSNPRPAD